MVNVDTVYQRVLAIANKEQRGYITPQEFNLFANQAQMDIFEQYFYDKNQFNRVPGNDYNYSDPVNMLEEKINIFKVRWATLNLALIAGVPNTYGHVNLQANLPDLYRLGDAMIQAGGHSIKIVEYIPSGKEHILYESNLKTKYSRKNYIYNRYEDGIRIHPHPLNGKHDILCNYTRIPNFSDKVEWAYVVVNGYAQYNGPDSINFEVHPSEENNLVIKILQLSGVSIKDIGLYQVAAQEEVKDIQQEKQ